MIFAFCQPELPRRNRSRTSSNEDPENSENLNAQTDGDLLQAPTGTDLTDSSDSSDEESEGSALEGASALSEWGDSSPFSTMKALEFKQYIAGFFKSKDIKNLIAKFIQAESWPVNYNT